MHRIFPLPVILPAAIAAAAFCAAPAWSATHHASGATTGSSTTADSSAASKGTTSAAGSGEQAARNNTQGKVAVDCVHEDPRKKADAPCAKVHPHDIPQPNHSTAGSHGSGSGQ